MIGLNMTRVPFLKLHGAGKDYVFIDGFVVALPDDPQQLAQRISDRNFSVGSDGLVFLIPPADDDADVAMRMWNSDGSEGAMCGNAARCIAFWMKRERRTGNTCRISTASGLVMATILDSTESSATVCVQLAAPQFPTLSEQSLEALHLPGGLDNPLMFTQVSIGNPHAVIFVSELSDRLVRQLGSAVSQHDRFPGGTNVEWVRVESPEKLSVRVWERGSGETLACGSGACAAVAAAITRGFCEKNTDIEVNLPGGALRVKWEELQGAQPETLLLTGPAELSFLGEIAL